MKYLTPTTWVLLVYWIPLMNLGPSLHHADIFGLHSSSCSTGCCGHHHGHSHSHHHHGECQDQANTCCQNHAPGSVGLYAGDTSDGCLFCEFFEKYNVAFSCFHFSDPAALADYSFALLDIFVSQDLVAATARGPPASILA